MFLTKIMKKSFVKSEWHQPLQELSRLQHFKTQKSHIKECSFRGCGLFDDAGLAIVIRNSYRTLESLDVAYTAVTWKGLALLSVVEKLKVLTVDNKVVGGKQGELKIALQGCDILILDKT